MVGGQLQESFKLQLKKIVWKALKHQQENGLGVANISFTFFSHSLIFPVPPCL